MTQRLLFDSFVEALIIRGYGSRITPTLRQRLTDHALDLGKLVPGYPAELLPSWLDVMADELFPGEPRPKAHEAMGRRFVTGWKETLLGRAIVPLVKLLSPHRALGRLERNFASTDNFTRIVLEDAGPSAILMKFNDIVGAPHFYEGLLDEGASLSSARNPKCTLLRLEAPGATFLCEWASHER